MYNSIEKFYELVAKGTENNRWDYKREIHLSPNSAFANLLKDILAFVNSGGGWLVIGVNDDAEILGLQNKIDTTSLGSKISSAIGEQIMFDLNYYNIPQGDSDILVGLLYVYDSEKVVVAPKDLYGDNGKVIISESTIYYRRNSSSIKANIKDLNSLIHKVSQKGTYKFKKEDLEIISMNKSEYFMGKKEEEFLKGDFKFSAIGFAEKINTIFRLHQSKYTKYEMGILLGFEIDAIDDYFEGKRFPKLEHLLRATEIFNLPHDYFFQTTIGMNMPFVKHPAITYIILEKTNDKLGLFQYGIGEAVKDIFYNLAREFGDFKEWLYHEERESLVPSEDEMNSVRELHLFNTYEKYLTDLSQPTYERFKKALSIQYYKELERTPSIDEKFLNERIIERLILDNVDSVCKFLAELIKEISIKENKLNIEYNFIYEVQHKLIRHRRYDENNLKVVFTSEEIVEEITNKM
ncbi:ATP-binding protein [Bacillus wiedmannii]|uniref:AlbA family DNA-binding domain-containing protein n=1 Tax=Bacillus wiedmannii TaxID=1890302 RepID=UPI002E238429|nr:ATP-binding protein [Bacillus wiedmannii]